IGHLERAAACDLDWEDGDTAVTEHYDHVKQWICELPPPDSRTCRTPDPDVCAAAVIGKAAEANASVPGPSGSFGVPATKDVVPSVSGCTASSRRVIDTVNDGSDLDSDFDDEFNLDQIATTGGMLRTIPNDEELDEPTTHIVNSIESAMDDVIDQMVGTSINFEWQEDFSSFRGVAEEFSGPNVGPTEDYDTPYDAFTAIHFENNSAGGQDLSQTERNVLPAKLRKLAPIIRHLNNKFSNLYNLHPDIAIDESLTLFKALARYLKSLDFDCLGTLRPNRKHVPVEIKNVPKSVASIIARHCGDVSCIAWKDTKVVTMISTYHTPEKPS
ncbi:hypothetical protein SFRURICE_012617, partial [Spodoptera frugiperda]